MRPLHVAIRRKTQTARRVSIIAHLMWNQGSLRLWARLARLLVGSALSSRRLFKASPRSRFKLEKNKIRSDATRCVEILASQWWSNLQCNPMGPQWRWNELLQLKVQPSETEWSDSFPVPGFEFSYELPEVFSHKNLASTWWKPEFHSPDSCPSVAFAMRVCIISQSEIKSAFCSIFFHFDTVVEFAKTRLCGPFVG